MHTHTHTHTHTHIHTRTRTHTRTHAQEREINLFKPISSALVDGGNLCSKMISGYADTGEYWRSFYESDTFQADLEALLQQLSPLYQQLHAYVRRKLINIYGQDKFPETGHIPAHLFGTLLSSCVCVCVCMCVCVQVRTHAFAIC